MTLAGLAMVGYGIYLLVEYERASNEPSVSPSSYDQTVIQFGRPILTAMSLSDGICLPKAWFIYLVIAIGVILCHFLFWLYWDCDKESMLPL
ncbi:hypothetical protein QN277_011171 [Acacia crassicarpa]|uniref:Uncharacterized protein n=1 Tax=Acacia crassicarpa TaxID=499986 RepID=A0AAE1TCC8_9FABA|nr:hypothetical protein QN277_011171 [Acacia crassicarpa]